MPDLEPEPFDVGDTSESFPVRTQQPRNADGTFAPANPPAPAAAADAPAAPGGHPDWLAKQAQELGFGPDEIAGTKTEALIQAVNRAYRQQAAYARELERARLLANPQTPSPVQAPAYAPATAAPAAFDYGVPSDQLSEVHPTILQAIRSTAEQSQRRIQDLERQLHEQREAQRQYLAQSQQRDANQVYELVDSAFASLPAKYHAILGKGSSAHLGQAGAHFLRRRSAVLTETGLTPQTVRQHTLIADLQRAADTLYGPALKEPAQPAVAQADWDQAALAQPTHRSGAGEPNGEQKAIRNLERRLREAGASAGQQDSEIMDGMFR